MDTLSDVNCRVSPEAHAFDDDRAAENRNVPDVDADHTEMSVMVSEVPPFVQVGWVDKLIDPDDAVPNVAEARVVEPAEIDVVPAEPGAAVCNWT